MENVKQKPFKDQSYPERKDLLSHMLAREDQVLGHAV